MNVKMNGFKASAVAFVSLFVIMAVNGCKGSSEKNNNTADSLKNAQAQQNIPGTPIKYDSSKRYIYLAFDDGPQPPGTTNCKSIFHSQGVKASFFMVGAHVFDNRRQRIVDSIRNGYPEFLLCNHTYTHANHDHYTSYYAHPDSALRDVIKAQISLGVPLKILRTPGNNSWVVDGKIKGPKTTLPLCHLLDSAGYSVIGWDVEWGFKNNHGSIPVQSVDLLLKQIDDMYTEDLSFTSNNVVLLAHDRMFEKAQYADSLTKFISTLKKDPRYVFETLDHYPGVKPNK